MFRHLLVPLDGSLLAEAAMPAVCQLAKSLQAEVTLLHMIEHNAPRAIHGQRHLGTSDIAEQYLRDLAQRTLPSIQGVHRHVHRSAINEVASSIVAHAVELQVDLIILCTHGAGNLRHGLFGTVCQRVIALGSTPVLLIPTPPKDAHAGFTCRRLLVPLDGNAEHEQGLSALTRLAPEAEAEVLLLLVIPNWQDLKPAESITSRLLPGTMVELLDASREAAQAYLDAKTAGLQSTGWQVTGRVVRGDPVSAIVAAAQDFEADLIVLGTHGKTHLDAFWSGSVTPQVARKSRFPLLLVPVGDGHR
jgi:nucleotide-binding universal stress UspA family protein